MKYLLGLDIGTSATKTVLFDETMKVIASASKEYPMYQPQNGWAEQNRAKDWYNVPYIQFKKFWQNLKSILKM